MSFREFAIETNSSQIEHNLLIAVTDHSNHHIIDYWNHVFSLKQRLFKQLSSPRHQERKKSHQCVQFGWMIGMIRKPHQIKRESNNGKERNKKHDEGVRRRLLWAGRWRVWVSIRGRRRLWWATATWENQVSLVINYSHLKNQHS